MTSHKRTHATRIAARARADRDPDVLCVHSRSARDWDWVSRSRAVACARRPEHDERSRTRTPGAAPLRVITYTSNTDTSAAVRNMFSPPSSLPSTSAPSSSSTTEASEDARLRILLETDAPYMVPAPIYTSAPLVDGEGKGKKLPLCYSGMVPWTAEFVAGLSAPSSSSPSSSLPSASAPPKEGAATQRENGGEAEKAERRVGRLPRHARRAGECARRLRRVGGLSRCQFDSTIHPL
ncbi:hypothetical protein MSAN_02456400 [Mycena sanguinolenta]|uniref:Uncharacterized protein n=1 Tax=Mycena sanguinolenta TaxID=230812 RepID=A0A8H7CAV9_9AGAR|nr:hypothetical protein MSAN_02456400 [Mycena sanguinolenta]